MPDLDTPEQIDTFIDAFYQRVFADSLLAPVFLDVAAIDVPEHVAIIKRYWRKMILGEDAYDRNMMARHEAVHGLQRLETRHFERWLHLYRSTLASGWQGPYARRADQLAVTIAGNMRKWLHSEQGQSRSERRVNIPIRNG
ncbi:group III truncated hemoglobin [Aquisalimonas sp. 2447]|uniref:group III truncated hemoglobin n=1 Tax=Aquisalimonas sp. 2447 TaxID=2740807 RepID=UPI001581132A|nr:group III truncated hemoglobin [Aquisalimonas sp. 2447]